MTRFSPLPLPLLAVALASCGGKSVCERAADIDCDAPPPDVELCEENIENDCSEQDVEHLEAFLDCLEDGELVCFTDLTADQEEEFEACLQELYQVSQACQLVSSTTR